MWRVVKITIFFKVGRRVPRKWFARQASKVMGLINFQANLWIIIKQSLGLAKKKANASKTIEFVMTSKTEQEDLHYQIEWIEIIIRGTREQEEDEHNDIMKLYDGLTKIFKKDYPVDKNLAKHFKTKVLNMTQVQEAYKKGYGASEGSTIAQKLLEMGIITYVEKVDDFSSREPVIPID